MATTINARDVYLQSQTRLLPVTIPAGYDFAGNVTGTINNVPAPTVTTQANNGQIANTETAQYRNNAPPTNAPAGGVNPVITINDDGSRDITLAWTYTQGTLPADGFILWYKQGNTTIVTTDPAYSLPATARSYRFMGAHQNTQYRAGIAAYRKTETGYQITAIYQPNTTPSWIVAATATLIGNVPVGTITGNAQAGFDIQQKLEVSGTTVLKGVLVPTDSGALKTGTITWNQTTGALTGGTGCAMTEWGILGAQSGVASFSLETSTGRALLAGDMLTAGDVVATGLNATTETVNVGGTYYFVDYSMYAKGLSSTTSTRVRAGLLGIVTAATSQYNAGVIGIASGTGRGVGVVGQGAEFGGYFTSTLTGSQALQALNAFSGNNVVLGGHTNALEVTGKMTINNNTLVTNLHADVWDNLQNLGIVANGSSTATPTLSQKPGTSQNGQWLKFYDNVTAKSYLIQVWAET